MAETGEVVTYGEFEARSNQFAHWLRTQGLKRLDHYSIFMENHARYVETCGGGARTGLYYTCVNSHLAPDELAFIINNSESQVLVTSQKLLDVAAEALQQCPNVVCCLVVDAKSNVAPAGATIPFLDYESEMAGLPTTPIEDESLGLAMLYSSGTTGRPKGILRELPEEPASYQLPVFAFLSQIWLYEDLMTYLSPAPLYHSAPQAAVGLAISAGGTAIIMERFDPEEYLKLVEQYKVTHTQLVPTMFSRMLKLPAEVRNKYDVSTLKAAVHAAAPCPVPVKEQMIEWWGPIILEYYGATEAIGFSTCNSQEWLAHPGTVGKIVVGVLHVLDDEMQPCAQGSPGTLWFESPTKLEYFNDSVKSAEATSPDGRLSTVGDIGYLDEDGYLFLTDRKTFMIISGGVNIYPQETENLLITHPKVADAAVFGVPNADLGEEVKAVVQPLDGVEPGPELERELTAFCQENLSRYKCPRSIDFDPELPRLPTGKLYKRILRDRYWGEGQSRISAT